MRLDSGALGGMGVTGSMQVSDMTMHRGQPACEAHSCVLCDTPTHGKGEDTNPQPRGSARKWPGHPWGDSLEYGENCHQN